MDDRTTMTTTDPATGPETMEQERFLVPPVDIYETRDEIVLRADVPGVTSTGIDIQVENRELTLVARRTPPEESRPGAVYREFEPASYRRTFTLGNTIDRSKVAAELADGVLTLHLPKVEEVKPRRIPIATR